MDTEYPNSAGVVIHHTDSAKLFWAQERWFMSRPHVPWYTEIWTDDI